MSDEQQDFQILITNADYEALKSHERRNKQLTNQISILNGQIATLNQKVRDLTRTVYIRDAFIEHIITESDYTFGPILDESIVSSDITQSFYQNVVSHEQNGISSIEMRDAIEIYTKDNQKLFDRFNAIGKKFIDLKQEIEGLKKKYPSRQSSYYLPEVAPQKPENKTQDKNKQKIEEIFRKQIQNLSQQLLQLNQDKQILEQQKKQLKDMNFDLLKQIQILNKKKQTKGEKSYILKLMIDEYYGELEASLKKVGGLTHKQLCTVVSNQMKGIVQYIQNLSRRALAGK